METKEVINRHVTFKDYIVGEPKESDFVLKSCTFSLRLAEGSQDVLVENLYFSIDPYQRARMKYYSSSHKAPFASLLNPGSVIDTYGVAKVIISNHPDFKEGDLVAGMIGIEDYSIIPGAVLLTKIKFTDIPLSNYVGVLGLTGFTAYAGLHNVCSPQKGEQVFISAACGAVGHLAGQFAKLQGCYVVGSCGSKQKVELLKNKFGFDDAFNYKEEPDLNAALKRYKALTEITYYHSKYSKAYAWKNKEKSDDQMGMPVNNPFAFLETSMQEIKRNQQERKLETKQLDITEISWVFVQ